jgi:hypothetical protein
MNVYNVYSRKTGERLRSLTCDGYENMLLFRQYKKQGFLLLRLVAWGTVEPLTLAP